MNMNERSIKQIVGKAVGRYNREYRNDCHGRVVCGDNSVVVYTTVARGDNVSWAKKPMHNYICASLAAAGYEAIWSSETHNCGNVSMRFEYKKNENK